MDETEAKKILVQQKHVQHEETLTKIIKDLESNLMNHSVYAGPESIFAHVKTCSEAILFLCQERKRDRDKRKGDYSKAAAELPSPGKDLP